MHPEKGFTLKENNYIDFMVRIRQIAEALNWELFCEKRPSVDEELFREFYMNLTSSDLKEVSIRGIKVPISSNAINEFFKLPNFEDDEYSSLMRNIEDKKLQEIPEELTVPGSKWTVSKQDIHTCCREYLTPLAKQQGEESEDPEEEDPTNFEPIQSGKIPDQTEPMEPATEPDMTTSMFRTQSPRPDLRDELSKLKDIMQHMQWQ
ncbi:hypothetical protein PVK06_011578 [Gossypium arboreum]|uniref:Putative plant transposon protein domain-containing protein n=1 Tax=Gossypium arboreum TaxID=29729 RepID=A0ABR0QA10_GOSAR|nr:hypothetical protein PVK06_011578 [Gossypium arboreum]